MEFRKILGVLSLSFVSLLVLTACDSQSHPPLKIGTNKWIGYESLFLAQELGLYKGRSIKLIEMPSATDVARSFRNESLDVAALTLDETLSLLQYTPDLRIILVMDRSVGADALIAKPDIRSLKDLKNKRIGVENTAVGAILLDAALQKAEMNASDIKLIPVTVNAHESYYAENKIDALVTFEPHKTRLLAKGGNVLFDSSRIPGTIIDVLVTRPEVIQKHPETLKALITGHFQALSHMRLHGEQAAATLSLHLGVAPPDVSAQLKGIISPDLNENRLMLTGKEPRLISALHELMSRMQSSRLLFKSIDTGHLVDGNLLPAEPAPIESKDS